MRPASPTWTQHWISLGTKPPGCPPAPHHCPSSASEGDSQLHLFQGSVPSAEGTDGLICVWMSPEKNRVTVCVCVGGASSECSTKPKCSCTKGPSAQGKLRESGGSQFPQPAVLPVSLHLGTSEVTQCRGGAWQERGVRVQLMRLSVGVPVRSSLFTVSMSPVGPGEEVPFLAAIWLPHGGQLWDQLGSSWLDSSPEVDNDGDGETVVPASSWYLGRCSDAVTRQCEGHFSELWTP